MYENDTQNKPIRIGISISAPAKEYLTKAIKEQSEKTNYSITVSSFINKLILQHKKENEQSRQTDD